MSQCVIDDCPSHAMHFLKREQRRANVVVSVGLGVSQDLDLILNDRIWGMSRGTRILIGRSYA